MFTNLNLIFLRHAQPAQTPKTDQNNSQPEQPLQKNKQLNCQSLIKDANISQNGRKQCHQIAQTLNWDSIEMILVSPLKRCLDTCKQLLAFSNRKVQVCVEPLLSARVVRQNAKGSSKSELERMYPQFCFSCLGNQEKIPWYLKYLFNKKKRRIQQLKNPSSFLQNKILQDPYEFRQRVKTFEIKLKNYLSNMKDGKRILIISHNQVFKEMTAKFYNADGQSTSDFKFDNAQLRYLSSEQLFHTIFPSPSPCL